MDTGATDHYFTPHAPLFAINTTAPPITIRTATGEYKTSSGAAVLAIPTLPSLRARTGHIIPGFTTNLISLGKLCDEDCTATIDKHHLMVRDKQGDTIMEGTRDTAGARLWRVNIAPPPTKEPTPTPTTPPITTLRLGVPPDTTKTPNITMKQIRLLDLPNTPALIAYLHATAGFPVKQTWLLAINRGAYTSWPGLNHTLVAKYCPDADETHKGHMAQPRQHFRSTQPQPQARVLPIPPQDTAAPTVNIDTAAPTVNIHIIPVNHLFTDDTGRFTPRSRSGNQYIMVGLHSESNAILVEPFKSKHDTYRIMAYNNMYRRLTHQHAAPDVHILDNEASKAFLDAITANNCKYQLVPPHVHRRNRAERAIRTFKDHFLSVLAGTAPSFPRDRWDLLLPQAELTLNLLRPSNNPTQSAWDNLFGPYNFDATPMGPAGSRVLIHTKATIRKSWDNRCHEGFYIGPALNHYRCYRVLNKATGAVTISDAIKFRHHYLPELTLSFEDNLLHAVQAINHTLTRNNNATTDEQLAAINTLRTILQTYQQLNAPLAPSDQHTPQLPGVPPRPKAQRRPGTHHASPGVPTLPPPSTPHPNTSDWTTVPTRQRTVATVPHQHEPIARRTRSHNAFAALADADDDDEVGITKDTDMQHHSACPVLDATTGKQLEHRHLRKHPAYKEVWDTSYSNELGRLCQGIGKDAQDPTQQRVAGTNTFRPIYYQDIPHERRGDITYTRVVCEVRPQKDDPNRTRITIEGDRICYPGDTGTKTGSIELVKLTINDVLSTPQARFACFDISNFYLGTPLDRPEFVRIRLADITQEFIDEYDLTKYAHNGWIHFEINKGVYGLKQAGKLANDLLTERLETYGYYQCSTTPGLWRHQWRPITFVLIVDDFGIKYVGKRHADHLLTALQTHYKVTTDWTGGKFAGIDLTWDYSKRICRLTMNNYINDMLLKYQHTRPKKPQHAPHAHRAIVYGAKEQLVPDDDLSPPLNEAGVKRIQGIIGSLLYYARACDNKLLATLSTISAQQAKATENTAKAVTQLLDYVATYPNDGITYRASNMILAAHADASYLTEPNSRSRAGAHIFLSEDDPIPRQNGPVQSISTILKFVMASASEAELAALYHTAREMVPLRNALEEMGWKQPPSPVQTDNSTALGFVHDTIIQRRIKMIWMRLHWLRCREAQRQFRFYWEKGSTNMADYHTKHHPPAYHLAHRATHAG